MNEKAARKRVKELKEFYSHLGIFLIVNFCLFLMDYASGNGWWFYWSVFGWGIGLAAHTFTVFGFSKEWEEKKIKELTRK